MSNIKAIRLAVIVSHPIQYYVPLYRRLAKRGDVEIKVFFTWHDGGKPQLDRGFQKPVGWDIPLTDGYEFELVPNVARDPGVHHFWGLRNPALIPKVLAWQPDAVHVTGYPYASHLQALRTLHRNRIPVLFRGDSHLLDGRGTWWRWQIKRSLLATVYRWPSAFLCVGQANKDYYRAFGVPETKLCDCPHSIETERFAEPAEPLEQQAEAWRRELGIPVGAKVVLFAGKFEDKKRPVPLMQAFLVCHLANTILLLVGDGADAAIVRELAAQHPQQFRVLPFQNQSKMPVIYRLGDLLVLPSAYRETWGLAVNEAMACGRPVLVSDRVGCQADMIRSGWNGDVFGVDNWQDFQCKLQALLGIEWATRRKEIRSWANHWSIEKTEITLLQTADRAIVTAQASSGR